MRGRILGCAVIATGVLSSAVVGCQKSSGGETPAPGPTAVALKIVDPSFGFALENTAFTVTVLTLGTAGVPANFSGTASIETATDGFVTPTSIALSGTATTLVLNYRLGGDNHLVVRAAGLSSAHTNVYVQGERPAVESGPLAGGAVLVGSGVAATWDSAGVWAPSVVSGATMRMYYSGVRTGQSAAIGLATSTDGIHWTRSGSTPIVGPGATASACHTNGADRPVVIAKAGGGFLMFYRGKNAGRVHVCLAESTDGTTWAPFAGGQQDGSVLAAEAAGTFDSTSIDGLAPFSFGAGYGALYTFHGNYSLFGPTLASGFAFATSTDGHVWTRQNAATASSALEISWSDMPPGDSWDSNALGPVTVFPEQDAFRIWAHGRASDDRLGYYTTFSMSFIGGHCDNFLSPLHEVVPPGALGTFSEGGVDEPAITVGPDGKRWIYVTGTDVAGRTSIGVARFSQ